ncbi:MAG: hypothetical protein ABSD62_14675 [Candidatus Limnocylindrales bacterium]|jgi:hypothetical protein
MSERSAFCDALSVTSARSLLRLLQTWDDAHALSVQTARPGISTEVAACLAAARLDIIVAYQARVRDWSALDAYLEELERDRIAFNLSYNEGARAAIHAQLHPDEVQP